MKTNFHRVFSLVLLFVLLMSLALPGLAAEDGDDIIYIHTAQDLQAMRDNPSGHYVLAEDLDMTGIPWEPVDFSGVFDGADHGILNLELSQPGDSWAEVLDGNRKAYQSRFAGLFGKLENAEVRNLWLMNVRSVLSCDDPIFIGGVAGYSYESKITNCTITGVLELRAHNQIFGVGGVVGYGSGEVSSCDIQVTLICVDTDRETKDEQFLGGIYSNGFMDVLHNHVQIHGCVSEHGYAHNGGIVGLYMQKPLGQGKIGQMSYNTVDGEIVFFENNRDRRAYCDAYAGEKLADRYIQLDNRRNFERIELKQYDQEIRPCMCETPDIREWYVASSCKKHRYGHSCAECFSCGYDDLDNYTFITHTVSNWELVEPATEQAEGRSEGICDECGATQTRVEPMLVPAEPETQPPVVQTQPVEAPVTAEQKADVQAIQGKIGTLLLVLGITLVILIAVVSYLIVDLIKSRRK